MRIELTRTEISLSRSTKIIANNEMSQIVVIVHITDNICGWIHHAVAILGCIQIEDTKSSLNYVT